MLYDTVMLMATSKLTQLDNDYTFNVVFEDLSLQQQQQQQQQETGSSDVQWQANYTVRIVTNKLCSIPTVTYNVTATVNVNAMNYFSVSACVLQSTLKNIVKQYFKFDENRKVSRTFMKS